MLCDIVLAEPSFPSYGECLRHPFVLVHTFSEILQMLFISVAAMLVPHLVLGCSVSALTVPNPVTVATEETGE